MTNSKYDDNNHERGSIKITDEVVGIIAGIAATEVEGSRHERRYCRWNCRNVRHKILRRVLRLLVIKKPL